MRKELEIRDLHKELSDKLGDRRFTRTEFERLWGAAEALGWVLQKKDHLTLLNKPLEGR